MNIKSEEAHRLARELAKLIGESLTVAVAEAVRERLERLQRERKASAIAEDLLAIGRRCARQLKDMPDDYDSFLYDDRGLFRSEAQRRLGAKGPPSWRCA